MKITLPENISEITLSQYMRYYKLTKKELSEYDAIVEKVVIFTGLTRREVESIEYKDLIDINTQIDKALNERAEFKNRFYIDKVEFGFVTLDKIKGKEYVDLVNYSKDLEDVNNYHKLMAILFRPIINKSFGGTYEIAEYDGTSEWCEIMKRTPMNIVNGALSFFLNLQNELLNYIQKYTKEVQARDKPAQTISISTDG